MIWHNSSISDVTSELNTDISCGLSTAEANDRLEKYGYNKFKADKSNSVFRCLLQELKAFHNIALTAVSVIYFILSLALKLDNRFESLIILMVLLINITVAAFLKYFTEIQLEKVKDGNESYATVVRDGEECVIPSSHIVPGDILVVKTGDYIKADGRLIDSYALAVEEFVLTGETAPAEKHHDLIHEDITPIINRQNMIYSGSTVLNGKGLVAITETAANTEIGMRKDMHLQIDGTDTVLTTKLSKIHRTVSTIILYCSIIVFALGVLIKFSDTSISFAVTVAHNLLLGCALFVACTPNIISFFAKLSRSAAERKLKKYDISLAHRKTAEELKETTVLCVDKTGIITTEEHTLIKLYNSSKVVDLREGGCDDTSKALLRLALICSNFTENEHAERHTNNMEKSIEDACIENVGMSKTDIDGLFPKLAEIPFDSKRMLMTTVTAISGNPVAIVKGAPEVIIPRCDNIDIEGVQKIAADFAKEGLKVIAVAVKPLSEIPANPNSDELEFALNFAGILGFEDKIESNTATLCKECAAAGIKTVMITGDHFDTAVSAGIKAGIISDESQAICGELISQMNDTELNGCIEKCSVFSRVSPEDKLRIVKAFKARGEKVLVTGDSIDDAMALIEADFGCALGKTASDMIKDSADIVIGDNKYNSIVTAIKESVNVFSSVKKALLYIFSLQTVLSTVMILGLLIYGNALISAAGALVLAVITLTLPLIAFFAEDSKENLQLSIKENKIFNKDFVIKLIVPSVLISLLAFISYGIISGSNITAANTSVFSIIAVGQIANAISINREKTIFSVRLLGFRSMLFAAFIGLIITLLFAILPIGNIFGIGILSGIGWLMIPITIALVLIANETVKLITKSS